MTYFSNEVVDLLLSAADVSHLTSLRRSDTLFSQAQPAGAAFLIQEGLVKLTRTNGLGGRIILGITGPGQLIGEEALLESTEYYTEAEVLTSASVARIPHASLRHVIEHNGTAGAELAGYLLYRKLTLAEKVELLCLHDVQYRILHYLAELSKLVQAGEGVEEFQIPITQLELADLIGATRETTSTTLNQLERRGLVKLSRRLLTVPSPHRLREAAIEKGVAASAVNGSSQM